MPDHPSTATRAEGEATNARASDEVDPSSAAVWVTGGHAPISSRGCDAAGSRRAAIVRLLETRDDHLPEPRRRVAGPAGFVSGVRERSCPDCLANGAILKGCETCHGSGTVSSGSSRISTVDEQDTDGSGRDPYASEVVLPFGFDLSRHDGVRDRDAEIDRLDEQLRPPRSEAELLEEANLRPFGWEAARARMWAEFDYGALDAGLELLRGSDSDACRALHAVYVYGWLRVGPAVLVERGLVFLEGVMPDPLRAPGVAAPAVNVEARGRGADRRALDQRDGEIRRLILEEHVATVVVADRFGLSVARVNRVVAAG